MSELNPVRIAVIAPVPWAATTSALSPRSPKPSSSPSPDAFEGARATAEAAGVRFTPIPPR